MARIVQNADGVGVRDFFGLRGANKLVGQIDRCSFWLQARPGGYDQPVLRGVVASSGFGSTVRVHLTRRSWLALIASIALPAPFMGLLYGDADLALMLLLTVSPTIAVFALAYRRPLEQTTWHQFKALFGDVLLDHEGAP